MNPTQAVQTAPQQSATRSPKKEIKTMLEGDQFKQAIAKVLPKHLTADRFVRVAIMAMTRTPKLAQCDQASFFQALMNLSQMGLEPDGRNAHLIPFENRKRGVVECQLIVDYRGLAELAMRSGMVSNIHADVVCDNDTFEYDRGELKAHKIDFRKPRGDVYAAYSLVRFKDGSEKCVVMSRDEIEGIRKRSRAGQSGPWVTDWSEMAKKTTFRRLSKWLSLSPEFRDALDKDSDTLEDIRVDNAKVIPMSAPTFEIPETVEAPEVETETQPESQPPTEGGTQPEPQAEKKQGRPVTNFTKAIRGLLALAGITEIELMDYLHASGRVGDDIGTISAMPTEAQQAVHDNWQPTVDEIKKLKGAAAA